MTSPRRTAFVWTSPGSRPLLMLCSIGWRLGTGEMALSPNKSASRRRGLQICAILAELCEWARRRAHDQLLERDLLLLSSECLTGSNSDRRSAALPWRSEAFGAPRGPASPVAPTQSAARASAFESRASSSSWLRSSRASTCPDHRHLSQCSRASAADLDKVTPVRYLNRLANQLISARQEGIGCARGV
jgi:hypothetical protein